MGIINGYEDDSFKPQQSITRAEVAAMIYRVATGDVDDEKADINAGAKLFTDVNADDWFAGYVNYCGDAEYIKGLRGTTPSGPTTTSPATKFSPMILPRCGL